MKLNYLKEKKELVSVVLLGVSAFLAVLIFVKVSGFWANSARAEGLVERAVAQNNADANDADKYFTQYKTLADVLKKNNLFAPPEAKQHPVNEVWGIFGNEVLIKDKWYKVGDTIEDAKIVAIGTTQVTIEWDSKEKTFAPIDAATPQAPKGSKAGSAVAKAGQPGGGSAEMVSVGSQQGQMGRPGGGPGGFGGFRGGGGPEGMRGGFQGMSERDRDQMRERFQNMSEAERERFRANMRERFGGGQSGGRPSGGQSGGRPSGGQSGGRSGGGDRRGGR